MPNAAPHSQPAPVDSATTDSANAYYAPQYADAFPTQHAGIDTLHSNALNSLPVMPMPEQQASKPNVESPLRSTGTMGLMLLSAFLITVSYKSGYKYIEHFFHNMFSTRKRENVFYDHTLNETRMMSALIFNTCIMMGITIFFAVSRWQPSLAPFMHQHVFLHIGIFSGLALLFYLLQIVLFKLLGYVFSDKVNTTLWLNGFKASQSLLGLLLFPIVCIMLVFDNTVNFMLILAVLLYFSARIVFICKGFRIFFNNLSSTIYFILYLCSAEIVPPILFCVGTIFLCTLLQDII